MSMIKKKNVIWFFFILSFVFFLNPIASNAKEDILYLKKNDFDTYFRENSKWRHFYEDRDRKCRLWNSPFVCWNRKTRQIIIPDLDKFLLKNKKDKKILPENLAADLKKYCDKKNKDTYLITKDEMILFSLKYLIENKYYFVKWVKDQCIHKDDNICFYILDLFVGKKMDIYYGLYENPMGLMLITNPISIGDDDCIEEWEKLLKKGIKKTEIEVQLKALIGNRTITDIYPDIPRITFYDQMEPSVFYKDIVKKNRTPIPVITLTFDLSIKRDFEMLKTNGIWIRESKADTEENNRISYFSIYSLMLDFYNQTKSSFSDNTFKMFYARTGNFYENTSGLSVEHNDDIRKKELLRILSFIKDIIKEKKNRGEKVIIQLIGFADDTGNKKDFIEWKLKNRRLSEERANEVKKWLEDNLGNLIDQNDIKARGCGEEYYDRSYRCVDIMIF
jgi:hypothetical protein